MILCIYELCEWFPRPTCTSQRSNPEAEPQPCRNPNSRGHSRVGSRRPTRSSPPAPHPHASRARHACELTHEHVYVCMYGRTLSTQTLLGHVLIAVLARFRLVPVRHRRLLYGSHVSCVHCAVRRQPCQCGVSELERPRTPPQTTRAVRAARLAGDLRPRATRRAREMTSGSAICMGGGCCDAAA